MNDRLYRSRDDRMIAGVAGGLAESLGLDPSLVRVGWVILALVTGGLLALVYVVMMFVVPEEPSTNDAWARWQSRDPAPKSSGPAPAPWQPDAAATGHATTGTGADGGASASATPTPSTAAETTQAAGGDRPTEAIPPPPPPDPRSPGVAGDEVPRTPRDLRDQDRIARRDRRAGRRAERRDGNTGSIVFGLLLVVVGAWFLARQYLPAVDFDRLWPFGLVVVGVALVVLSVRPSRRDG